MRLRARDDVPPADTFCRRLFPPTTGISLSVLRLKIGSEDVVAIRCGTCAVLHALPAIIYDTAQQQGGFWHCPNGHSRGWARGADRDALAVTRRERDRLKQENARLAEEAAAAERKRLTAERAVKRHKTRAAAGLCPCCNRSFVKLRAHIATKHPEYSAAT